MTAGEERGRAVGLSQLAEHVAECDMCRAEPLPLEQCAAFLSSSAVRVDVTALSQDTLRRLQPELARRARAVLWHRVTLGVLAALLPLPAVLAYDAYLLRLLYGLASAVLPAAFATYLVVTYAAFLVLLFGSTYAAIPLLVARSITPHHANQG